MDLGYASSDAAQIALVVQRELEVRSTTLLTSESALDLLATRNNIIRVVCTLGRNSESASIIYFAGHGINVDGSFHLCPQDFDPRIPVHSAVRLSLLVELLLGHPTWSLLIVDACRVSLSSSMGRKILDEKTANGGGFLISDNVCLFLSCSGGQRSFETPSIAGQQAGGVFTHFLCKGLAAKRTRRGRLLLSKWFEQAQVDTATYVARTWGKQQTARAIGMNPGDVYLQRRQTTHVRGVEHE
jgi:uncharacterized caspase-like protein